MWLLLAGRGFGKSRTGAEWVRAQVESGRCSRLALVAPTSADCRDVMVEGESGMLAVCPPWNRPVYETSKRRLTWPNGAIATLYSADEPDRLRGPQHDGAWCDEIAAWRYPEAWDQLMFGLRLGLDPRTVATTTPRPIALIKSLMADPTCHVTRGTTYDNLPNLAPQFAAQIVAKYQGTRLGRQELLAEVLTDTPGALWTLTQIDANRRASSSELVRIVIAVDPAATSGEEANETGIVAAGVDVEGKGYVLADRSLNGTPDQWARAAWALYDEFEADSIVYESNQGGDMVAHTLLTVRNHGRVYGVHASRGKRTRAEPIAAMYEQGRVHHVGSFKELEDQMCSWTPEVTDSSPDRMDALVWALTTLLIGYAPFNVAPESITKEQLGQAKPEAPKQEQKKPTGIPLPEMLSGSRKGRMW